ncbi:hypothetical protein CLV48_10678 [Cecembia rubra]|uniref:Uncharacterized protein n=1 Tax=Cecembia rubra TaxID=1485585 RepID=A0A2P8E2Y3_9BACT|nr:hypothetical protein CLV48_10678 [Cecembia rubra]
MGHKGSKTQRRLVFRFLHSETQGSLVPRSETRDNVEPLFLVSFAKTLASLAVKKMR